MDDLSAFFFEEAADSVEQTRAQLGEVETPGLGEHEIIELARLLHNLKGTSASVGFKAYSQVVHAIEDRVAVYNEDRERSLSRSYALELVDQIETMARRLESGHGEREVCGECLAWIDATFEAHASVQAAAADAGATPRRQFKAESSIRVPERVLDNIFEIVEELTQIENSYRYRHAKLAKLAGAGLLSDIDDRFEILLRKLNHNVLSSRRVPFTSVARRMQRIVSDYLAKNEKRVEFVIEGQDAELDKSVIDILPELLAHVIKNGLDHGIETPEQRRSVGKDECAKLLLRVYQDGDTFRVEARDDGRGISPHSVAHSAIDKGVVTAEEVAQMDDNERQRLIFRPGFSTAVTISETSGRGVGMDAVLDGVTRLNGKIELHSQVGQGTCVAMVFPASLRFVEAFVAVCGEQRVMIPVGQISSVMALDQARAAAEARREGLLAVQGEFARVMDLGHWLGFSRGQGPCVALLCRVGQELRAFLVDRIEEKIHSVVKDLHSAFNGYPWLQGGIILGNGDTSMLLDLIELFSHHAEPALGKLEEAHAA